MDKYYHHNIAGIFQAANVSEVGVWKDINLDIRFPIEECTLITPACPHAPQMLQAAYDAFEHEEYWLLWEGKLREGGEYRPCTGPIQWFDDIEYRRKSADGTKS